MTKSKLIETLRIEGRIPKKTAAAVVETFFGKMTNALSKGSRVEIRGFCSFHVRKYKAYKGRNPKTGKPVKVKSEKRPFFKCGRELKNRLLKASIDVIGIENNWNRRS